MSTDTTEIATVQAPTRAPIALNMATVEGFESLQRAAAMLARSGMLPERWRPADADQKTVISNCAILLEMATRIGANPIAVAQNLYLVYGTPGWSAQFLIACANASGRFTSLRYEFRGTEPGDDWACRAWAKDARDGERLDGGWVSIGDAKRAGWYCRPDKHGKETSKWPVMPEQMLRYRAAAYWARVYCPEIAMGLGTREEAQDIGPQRDDPAEAVTIAALPAPADEPRPAKGRKPQAPPVVSAEAEVEP